MWTAQSCDYNLALIKRTGGLYEKILTAVVSTDERSEFCVNDGGQDSPMQTD